MAGRHRKGLYFCAGMVPTDAERTEADSLGLSAFRNASQVETSALERSELVAGLVPAGYDKMPGCRVIRAQKPSEQEEPTEENTRPASAKPVQGKAGK